MSITDTAPISDYRFFFAPEPKEDGSPRRMTFTIKSPTAHFTFKVTAKRDQKDPTKKILFLSVMTGSDNESSYSYVGILGQSTENPPRIFTTKGTKVTLEAQSVRALLWTMRQVKAGTLPEGYEVLHSGKCCRCGRKLTTPESVKSGIGPVCATLAGW